MFGAEGEAELTQSSVLPEVKPTYLLLEIDFYLSWTESLMGSHSEPADNLELQRCITEHLRVSTQGLTPPGTLDAEFIPQMRLVYPSVSTK